MPSFPELLTNFRKYSTVVEPPFDLDAAETGARETGGRFRIAPKKARAKAKRYARYLSE